MKTSDLIGPTLDWAVAEAEGRVGNRVTPDPQPGTFAVDVGIAEGIVVVFHSIAKGYVAYTPSTDWAQGGPIIEREKIAIDYQLSSCIATTNHWDDHVSGPTPLIAAMRCYVASKLGDEVDVPPN